MMLSNEFIPHACQRTLARVCTTPAGSIRSGRKNFFEDRCPHRSASIEKLVSERKPILLHKNLEAAYSPIIATRLLDGISVYTSRTAMRDNLAESVKRILDEKGIAVDVVIPVRSFTPAAQLWA